MESRYHNVEAEQRSGEHVTFSFGSNWVTFLSSITLRQEELAQRSLAQAFGREDFAGLTFLDIGCGSGLFSLSALRLGADRVISVDVDPNSCECAARLREREGSPAHWEIRRGSILEAGFVRTLEPADCVYSWGVLHHTGAMWAAIANVVDLAKPGGVICLALYNRPNHLRLHLWLKRSYNRLPRLAQRLMVLAYGTAWLLRQALRGRWPVSVIRGYSQRSRGMGFWRDVEDWLGGLPFETVGPREMRSFASHSDLVLQDVVIRSPGNNNEYLLQRNA